MTTSAGSPVFASLGSSGSLSAGLFFEPAAGDAAGGVAGVGPAGAAPLGAAPLAVAAVAARGGSARCASRESNLGVGEC